MCTMLPARAMLQPIVLLNHSFVAVHISVRMCTSSPPVCSLHSPLTPQHTLTLLHATASGKDVHRAVRGRVCICRAREYYKQKPLHNTVPLYVCHKTPLHTPDTSPHHTPHQTNILYHTTQFGRAMCYVYTKHPEQTPHSVHT